LNSGLNRGMSGYHPTSGDAFRAMLERGSGVVSRLRRRRSREVVRYRRFDLPTVDMAAGERRQGSR
jgi:hypothetical protein